MAWKRALLLLALWPWAMPRAEVAAADGLPVTRMETLVVSGEQPGPGMWRVSRDGHELWLLGSMAPLPKRMQWNSKPVEAAVAASSLVLMPPAANFDVKGGFFGGLLLLPSALKARNNPEGQTLAEVLPPELYARWQALKAEYLGRGKRIEKRRPIVAAEKLQEEALDEHDLSLASVVNEVVRKAAKRADVELQWPNLQIRVEEPRKLLKQLADTPLEDVECFRRVVTRLENDIETMKLRANAWAMGELEILQRLPYTDANRACMSAVLENKLAREHGFDDLPGRLREVWLEAAEAALRDHTRSFAVLPMRQLLDEDGYLAVLAQRGYRVQSPQQLDAEAAAVEVEAEAAPSAAATRASAVITDQP